jgi:hypothetical protein
MLFLLNTNETHWLIIIRKPIMAKKRNSTQLSFSDIGTKTAKTIPPAMMGKTIMINLTISNLDAFLKGGELDTEF